MPAAAVIPAPRAYTIIAAVKTPVVCHWVAGLLGGLSWAARAFGGSPSGVGPSGRGKTPSSMSCARSSDDGAKNLTSSCRKPPSLGAERWLCLASGRGRILATVPVTVQAEASVHHRSRLSVTPWKTQCAQRVHPRLDAHPWNVKASTEQGTRSCAGLGACSGQCGAWS